MKKILALVLALGAVLSVAAFAWAAEDIGFVTDKTLNFIVPGKPGGGSDLAIRYYAQALTDVYGLKTTVTNYDSNTIGHQMVKDAKPDGTTLTLATGALNIQYITGNSDIDPMNDFTLIACMQDNGYSALAVPKDAPYDDFAGFAEYAKAHPGEINVGMPAAGSNTFLFGQITGALGLQLNPVEMASESDRLTNLAGGFIDIGVVGVGHGLEYEQAGKLKIIGTVASDGTTIAGYPEALPDNYKTLQEQGFQDCYYNVYHYLLGPAGMDETMVKEMNASMQAIYEATKIFPRSATFRAGMIWKNLRRSAKRNIRTWWTSARRSVCTSRAEKRSRWLSEDRRSRSEAEKIPPGQVPRRSFKKEAPVL